MKHFVQYTAILGAVLTVLGFGTAGAARINGARWSRMHIEQEDMVIPGTRHHQIIHAYDIPSDAETGTSAGEGIKIFPAAYELSISLEYGNLTIEYGDVRDIQIVCDEDSMFGEVVWAYTEDGEMNLAVYGKRETNWEPDVSVILPRDLVFQEVNMEIGSGNCTALDLETQELNLDLAVGEIVLENMVTSYMDIDCTAGNISYSGRVLGDMEADCAVGNITLCLHQEENDFNYELEGAGGNIQVGEDTFSGFVFSKESYRNADKTMRLQAATGNIQVQFFPTAP